ncbi:MAG: branched-chain amino acid ABC transporter permease [Pseudomonadota bacterium]
MTAARLLPKLYLLLAILGLLGLPFVVTDSYSRHLLILAFIFAVVASNWDLSLGYGGIFNFAHLAFFSIGVYGYGILAKTLGFSPWLAIPLAGLLSAIAALIVAIPVLRLSGVYIILVTFAFSQLVLQLVVSQSDITGGMMGMVGLPPLSLPGYNVVRDGKFAYYYGAVILLLASTVYLRVLVKQPFGVSVMALRDNAEYAISRGVSLARQRTLTLVASAVFTGIAGGYYGAYLRVAAPDAFGLGLMTLLLSMLLLGGTATVYGPIIAAVLLTFLSEAMVDFGAWRHLVIAAIMIAVLIFYPRGLWEALTRLHLWLVRRLDGR